MLSGDVGAKPAAARTWQRLKALLAIAAIAACGLAPAYRDPGGILGRRPGYRPAAVGPVPNRAAIGTRIWLPGLDGGFDPQGLALVGDDLFVSGYESVRPLVNRGPCHVFRIEPQTGASRARLDIPPPCGHAGGLAAAGGRLYVADTHTLFVLAPDGGGRRRIALAGALRGAYATVAQDRLWLGSYSETGPGRIWGFPLAIIARLGDGAVLTRGMAAASYPMPSFAQGAALDRGGALWVARSQIGWGYLDRREPATGRLLARYPAPAGIEGIAFAGPHLLWAVSETGARHIPLRYPFFPLIFAIDTRKLTAGQKRFRRQPPRRRGSRAGTRHAAPGFRLRVAFAGMAKGA